MELLDMFKSKWCWLTTLIALIASIYFVKKVFLFSLSGLTSWFTAVNVFFFVILFSLSFSCTIREIRLKIKEAKRISLSEGGMGLVNLILYILGFTALQTCVVSGMCGVGLAIPLISLFLPFGLGGWFLDYGEWILFGTNLLLFASLLYMRCFISSNTKNKKNKEDMLKIKF